MQVLGHGIDIEECSRVRRLLQMPRTEWLAATFSAQERESADLSPHDVEFYAGRFAAKEAVSKALGTGISGEIAWTDIEILRRATGMPEVRLSNEAKTVAMAQGITAWLLSISHSEQFAIASALALKD